MNETCIAMTVMKYTLHNKISARLAQVHDHADTWNERRYLIMSKKLHKLIDKKNSLNFMTCGKLMVPLSQLYNFFSSKSDIICIPILLHYK